MPRNVFEEEGNAPINQTDSSAVKLSSSAEVREKEQRICFAPEPIWELALVTSSVAQLLGQGCTSATGATSVPSSYGFRISVVVGTPVPGVGWSPPNTFMLHGHSQPWRGGRGSPQYLCHTDILKRIKTV